MCDKIGSRLVHLVIRHTIWNRKLSDTHQSLDDESKTAWNSVVLGRRIWIQQKQELHLFPNRRTPQAASRSRGKSRSLDASQIFGLVVGRVHSSSSTQDERRTSSYSFMYTTAGQYSTVLRLLRQYNTAQAKHVEVYARFIVDSSQITVREHKSRETVSGD